MLCRDRGPRVAGPGAVPPWPRRDDTLRPVPTVAEVIVRHLHAAGTRALFGVPGGGSNLDVVDAGSRVGVRFVLTATETAAAIAAVAESEISGRVGACLAGLGPG